MQLPPQFVLMLQSLVVYLVTDGLKVVGQWFKIDVSGFGTVLVAAVVGAIVLFANSLLAAIPAANQPLVQQILALVALLLGAFGVSRNLPSQPNK